MAMTSKKTAVERKWMQGLRYIEEGHLDTLYRSLLEGCTDLRASSTASQAIKLKKEAQQGIEDISAAFLSVDFASRCAIAPPDGLQKRMKQLMPATNATKALTSGVPKALEPP